MNLDNESLLLEVDETGKSALVVGTGEKAITVHLAGKRCKFKGDSYLAIEKSIEQAKRGSEPDFDRVEAQRLIDELPLPVLEKLRDLLAERSEQ
jgi:hypothetical protein